MRIAFLAHAGSVHTRRWSVGLASRGHDIRILTNSDFLGLPKEIKTDLLPGRTSLSYFRNIPRVKKILRRYNPDIVHAHYATGYGLWGSIQKSAPLIVTVWGTDIADALAGKFMIAPVVRRALKAACYITGASQFLLDQAMRFEPSVKDKLVHIPFGVDISPEEPSSEDENHPVQIIFSKQFYPVYAPELVLRAFAKACHRVSNIKLLMIGGGPLHEKLLKTTEELNVKQYVDIRDWVEMGDAERLIRQSDIMVMPSERESFGVAALEAAAAGVPVIATDVGGIPEIVENDYNGLLISPGDENALTEAIIRLADDSILRQRMGEAGRKIARERYNFQDCLDRMENLYQQVAGH